MIPNVYIQAKYHYFIFLTSALNNIQLCAGGARINIIIYKDHLTKSQLTAAKFPTEVL